MRKVETIHHSFNWSNHFSVVRLGAFPKNKNAGLWTAIFLESQHFCNLAWFQLWNHAKIEHLQTTPCRFASLRRNDLSWLDSYFLQLQPISHFLLRFRRKMFIRLEWTFPQAKIFCCSFCSKWKDNRYRFSSGEPGR